MNIKKTAIIVWAIVAILISAVSVMAAASEHLTSYYSFNTNVTNDDQGSNHGTNSGVHHNTSTSFLGNGSAYFDTDNDYIEFPTGISVQPITINAWVDTDSQSGNNYFMGIDKNSLWPYSMHGFGKQLCLRRQGSDGCASGDNFETGDGYVMYTMVLVNNTLSKAYKNGVSLYNYTNTQTFSSSYDTLTLGTLSTSLNSDSFEGYIDEVSIYDDELTLEEISDLYNNGNGCDLNCISQNSAPSTPTNITINSTNDFTGNFSGTQTIKCEGSTDPDGDTITYIIEKGNYTGEVEQITNTSTKVTKDSDTGNDTITFSAQNCGSECAADAFDNDLNTKWLTLGENTAWIKIELGDFPKRVGSYQICSGNDVGQRDPDDWTLEGSKDDENWYILDKVVNNGQFGSRSTCYDFTIDGNQSNYYYYKLNVTQNNGDSNFQISEINLYEQTITNVSNYEYSIIGNHTTTNYSWSLASEEPETYEKFRCTAVDDGASNTNSSSYVIDSNFQISTSNPSNPQNSSLSPVINLTFNNAGNRLEDSTGLHTFTNNGVSFSDNASICLWHGCATDLDGIDYIYTTANFNHSTNGFGFKFWVKHDTSPESNVRPGYFWFQTLGGTDGLTSGEDGTGWQIKAYNTTGNQLTSWFDYDDQTPTDKWYQLGMVYNATTCSWKYYRDGSLYATRSDGCIDMTDAVDGLTTRIFNGRYWEGGGGAGDYHMDEFVWFNNTDGLTDSWFLKEYNEKRLGTPPNADLYIKKISYEMPINWSHDRNIIIPGSNLTINITIKNEGTENANKSQWLLYWDSYVADAYANRTSSGTTPCTGYVTLNAGENNTVQCNLTTRGFWYGHVAIDTNNNNSEDVENNNNQTIMIPFVNRPWFHFNETEWLNAENVVNQYEVSKDDYTWTDYGGCSAFNNGYDCNDVDPYGKYARTCAFSCVRHNYSGYGCDQARVHLEGWSNRTMSGCTLVQNLHEASHVGIAYDMMFPNMTKNQANDWADGFEDMCQAITNLPNTRPDLDNEDLIVGDNGQGFSSGFASLCYAILGAEVDNPTLIQEFSDEYWGLNIPTEWMQRERRFIRAYKNESQGMYQEGNAYLFYSMYHHLDNSLFHQRWKLFDLLPYQAAYDAIALEMVSTTLDFNYNGNDLRNDRDQMQRFLQRGDSRSYAHPSDGSTLNRAVFTLAGLTSTNTSIQKSILWLRNKSNAVGDADIVDGWADAYLYPLLAQKVSYELSNTVEGLLPNVLHDDGDDIITIRENYNFVNDTIIQIDGGEERGSGHSQAQGYYLYALGEPFLDYEQVPYEDDTRAETWKNGISMHNDTQTVEGQTSFYNADCTSAELSQYYGMSNCPSIYYSTNYPVYRKLSELYSGDINETYWNSDGSIASMRVWRPQSQADTTQEYFIKFHDMLIIRNVVKNSATGESYHNYININDEFNESRNGYNFNLSRGNKILETRIVYTNVTPKLQGGETGLQYCFGKTDCSGSYRGSGKYRRLMHYFPEPSADYVLVHQWYINGSQTSYETTTSGNDVVINRSAQYVILDTGEDGISYAGITTDSYNLIIINSTHVVVNNATYVDNGTDNATLPSTPYNGLVNIQSSTPSCTPSWTNTSWNNITGTCQENNTMTYSATRTEYDANACTGSTNTTYTENGTASCNYDSGSSGLIASTQSSNETVIVVSQREPSDNLRIWEDIKQGFNQNKQAILWIFGLIIALIIIFFAARMFFG